MNEEQEKKRHEEQQKEQERLRDFLLRDYELKVTYLTNHFQRMWMRFNFFVTIESALVGGKFLIKSDVPSVELAVAGALLSFIWYVMGSQDRYLVRLYRNQVSRAGKRVADTVWIKETLGDYRYIGEIDNNTTVQELKEAEALEMRTRFVRFLDWLSGQRRETFSPTRLAALFPLLVFLLWLVILVTQLRHDSGLAAETRLNEGGVTKEGDAMANRSVSPPQPEPFAARGHIRQSDKKIETESVRTQESELR